MAAADKGDAEGLACGGVAGLQVLPDGALAHQARDRSGD
jgi:hypothetical protein